MRFKAQLVSTVSADLTDSGKLFQSRGPATLKRWSTFTVFDVGWSSLSEPDERSDRDGTYWWMVGDKYGGWPRR